MNQSSNPGSPRHLLEAIAPGIVIAVVGAAIFYVTRDLSLGRPGSMGPGTLPRWLAIILCLCGAAMAVGGLRSTQAESMRWQPRGFLLVILSVVLFAVTIRSFDLGLFRTPALGLCLAAPLAILVAGLASPETRFGDLLILALIMTPCCMLLFGDLLSLPIPMTPTILTDVLPLPRIWVVRSVAIAMLAAGGLMIAWRKRA